MPIPSLPEELVAHIILNLDSHSLRAAALTGRAWLSPTRQRLFRHIYVPYKRLELNAAQAESFLDVIDRFGNLIEAVVWSSPGNEDPSIRDEQRYRNRVIPLKRIYERLVVLSCGHDLIHGIDSREHESAIVYVTIVLEMVPSLAPYFRWVNYHPGLIYDVDLDDVIEASVTAMQLLPNVRDVTLGDGSHSNCKEFLFSTQFTDHTPSSSIISLELNNWIMPSHEEDFCRFVAKFIHLSKLTMRYTTFQVESLEQQAPTMRYLDIRMSPSDYEYGSYTGEESHSQTMLLKWLATQRNTPPLETLIVNSYQFEYAPEFHRTLKCLHLFDVNEPQDLALFTGLVNLHIQSTSTINNMIGTIRSIRSDVLENLDLDLFSPPDFSLDYLRQSLDQPRFRQLRNLNITTSVNTAGRFTNAHIVKSVMSPAPAPCPE